MKVESDTTRMRPPLAPASPRHAAVGEPAEDWTSSPLAAATLKQLRGGGDRFLACAPGRLDVMGGLAEYTGSLIVNTPIREQVFVGAQRGGTDNELSVTSIPSPGTEASKTQRTVLDLSRLFGDGGEINLDLSRSALGEVDTAHTDAVHVLAAIVEMVHGGMLPRFDKSISIAVGSTLEGLTDVAREAAVVAATMVAAAGAYDVTLDAVEAATVCQRVQNRWLDLPVGVGDAVCVLLGEAAALMEVRCDPCTLAGSTPLPNELTLIGIDCGVTHPDGRARYAHARTAAFMGRGLIDRIIRHEGADHSKWEGFLSRVSVTDYVERFRDRIPTKLKGSEYLRRFGETGDPLTRIDPTYAYKIRSRTEHHIYEHMRTGQFLECIRRAIRNPAEIKEGALTEAGELMYASHWSYGQRCGLGSIETDTLVNLVREHGTDAGVYGAKITGRGCGGVVTVLMKTSDRANEAVNAAIQVYQSRTGYAAKLLCGSSAGALVKRVRKIKPGTEG